MAKIIHTIRVISKADNRCNVIYGEDQTDVIARAKAAADKADYYEVETWRVERDAEQEHGTMLTSSTVTSL